MQQERRLGAGTDPEFTEDGRGMGLDRGFGDIQLEGDLLVEQAFAEHGEHPELLRRETGKPGAGRLGLLAQGRGTFHLRWPPGVAVQHLTDGLLQGTQIAGLGDEAAGTELPGALHHGRFFLGRDHHHGHLGILAAQEDQTGKAVGAGHVEIEQDQIPVGALGQAGLEFGDVGHFGEPRLGAQAQGERLLQRAAKQRMIVGDQYLIGSRHGVAFLVVVRACSTLAARWPNGGGHDFGTLIYPA